jgi:RimJ/RimL family protein N-acetyltransferase
MAIEDLWPLFGLRIVSPRLTLRYPSDTDLAELADAAAAGIHDPAFMPFAIPWTDAPPEELRRNAMQFWWGVRASWKPSAWTLNMAVSDGDRLVGVQDLHAKDFPITRQVATGSWLTRSAQGHGVGMEMRRVALHLAFEGLDAQRATSAAFEDNAASRGVSRSLGYIENGDEIQARRGQPVRQINLVLDRATWEGSRRDDVRIEGLAPCLPLFGL